MSTIAVGTNYPVQATIDATSLDTDTESIRTVLDADGAFGGVGIDSVNLATTANFRTDQTAEPAARCLIDIPFLDISASTVELAPFSIRYYAVSPVNARLARASVGWRSISVGTGNTILSLQVTVMGYPARVSGTSYGVPGSGGETPNAAGLQTILQTTNDLKFVQFINRPAVAAWQPIPIDVTFNFDGSSFTMQGFRVQLELNVEHTR